MKSFSQFLSEVVSKIAPTGETFATKNKFKDIMHRHGDKLGSGIQASVFDVKDRAIKIYHGDSSETSPTGAWLDASKIKHKTNEHYPVVHRHVQIPTRDNTSVGIASMEKLHPLSSLKGAERHALYTKTFSPDPELPKHVHPDANHFGDVARKHANTNGSPTRESTNFVGTHSHTTSTSDKLHSAFHDIHGLSDDGTGRNIDIHGGNMMVRKHPIHGHQLVITDPLVDMDI